MQIFSVAFQEKSANAPAFALFILQSFCHIVDESFGVIPAKTSIGDRLAVDALADLLVALLDIAFDHKALEDPRNLGIERTGMKDLLRYSHLLLILLARVCVVTVDDERGIDKISLAIFLTQVLDVLVVIVGQRFAVLVHVSTQYRVGVRITRRFDLPAAVEEGVGVLCRHYRVEHDRNITARGIFHTDRDLYSA